MENLIQELFSLEGKVALVIGGTGVLCGEMAEGMAGAGARVILVGRNEEKARSRIEAIENAGGNADFIKADVGTKAALEELLQGAIGLAGHLDIVVNGAGVNSPTPFFEVEEDVHLVF